MHPDRPPIRDMKPAASIIDAARLGYDCGAFASETPLENWPVFPPDLNCLSDSDFLPPLSPIDGGAGAACGMMPRVPRDRVPAPLVAFWQFLCELARDPKGFAALTLVGGIIIGGGLVAAVIGGMWR